MTSAHAEHGPEGGDPVCWMHLICPSCGAMPDPETPETGVCPRCGEGLER